MKRVWFVSGVLLSLSTTVCQAIPPATVTKAFGTGLATITIQTPESIWSGTNADIWVDALVEENTGNQPTTIEDVCCDFIRLKVNGNAIATYELTSEERENSDPDTVGPGGVGPVVGPKILRYSAMIDTTWFNADYADIECKLFYTYKTTSGLQTQDSVVVNLSVPIQNKFIAYHVTMDPPSVTPDIVWPGRPWKEVALRGSDHAIGALTVANHKRILPSNGKHTSLWLAGITTTNLANSTVFFAFTHGQPLSMTDYYRTDYLRDKPATGTRSNIEEASLQRNPQVPMWFAFQYACSTADGGLDVWADKYTGPPSSSRTPVVAGFQGTIWSTLTLDQTEIIFAIPETLQMDIPLSEHTRVLLERLVVGDDIVFAMTAANTAFTPRQVIPPLTASPRGFQRRPMTLSGANPRRLVGNSTAYDDSLFVGSDSKWVRDSSPIRRWTTVWDQGGPHIGGNEP